MAWADWMVPELSLEAEARIEVSKRVLMEEVHRQPEQLAQLCGSLVQQNAMFELIISKATMRITELEIELALREG